METPLACHDVRLLLFVTLPNECHYLHEALKTQNKILVDKSIQTISTLQCLVDSRVSQFGGQRWRGLDWVHACYGVSGYET